MDGVFINLTPNDLTFEDDTGLEFLVKGNPELVTPTRQAIQTDSRLAAVCNETTVSVQVPMICEHIKYPFTDDQITKINHLSKGRTRLLILDPKDVEYWSIGRFKCPFRNYRLFTWTDNKTLMEYPIPKTYLDYVSDTVESMANATRKLYNKTGLSSDSDQ